MMKKLILPVCTLPAGLLLLSCGANSTGEIPVLDVTRSYPSKNVILQDIADIEYLPLESKEGFFIDHWAAGYMDDEVLITNNRVGDIMFFDRKTGEGLRSFNRTGRGPGEYTGIYSIAVDMKNNEMFVTPNSMGSSAYPVYVYDLQGKPLRTLEFKGVSFPDFFHNYDDGHLFFHNRNTSQKALFGLMSKTDTIVTRLPVEFEGRDHMSISRTMENGNIVGISANNKGLAKTADGYMISEPGLDTMYRWNRATGELAPVMVRTPSFRSMEYPTGLFYLTQNSDYMFLRTIERKYDFDVREGFKSVDLIYDKRNGEFYEGKILNGDFVDGKEVSPSPMPGISAGLLVMAIQPYELIDLHEQGKLRGRLAELAPTLKEDDNPVLMIATFK